MHKSWWVSCSCFLQPAPDAGFASDRRVPTRTDSSIFLLWGNFRSASVDLLWFVTVGEAFWLGLARISIIFTIRITDTSGYLHCSKPANRLITANGYTIDLTRFYWIDCKFMTHFCCTVGMHTCTARAYMKTTIL